MAQRGVEARQSQVGVEPVLVGSAFGQPNARPFPRPLGREIHDAADIGDGLQQGVEALVEPPFRASRCKSDATTRAITQIARCTRIFGSVQCDNGVTVTKCASFI